jgi:glycosyltransferase involved in cell wall biosynthesis
MQKDSGEIHLTQSPEEYSVVLCASQADAAAVRHTAGLLTRNTVSGAAFYLIASAALIDELMREPAFASFTTIRSETKRSDQSFIEVLDRFQNREFFFVRAGVSIPEAWDVRLAWTAKRHNGTATVSPLASSGRLGTGTDPDSLDRLCYQYSQREPLDTTPSHWCVFVTAESARAVVREWGTSSERSAASFAAVATALRFRHLLADHLYVEIPAHGNHDAGESKYATSRVIAPVREQVLQHLTAGAPIGKFRMHDLLVPRQLHVMHSWGGGLARWVTEYCKADQGRQNVVLKSIGSLDGFGRELWLYRNAQDIYPIRRWLLGPTITSTALEHEAYQAALQEILHEFGIEKIIVSSLIGHSLDVLRTDRPTTMVCHDYYPFCPALNITFGSVCRTCTESELSDCTKNNPHNRFFNNVPASYWAHLRAAFLEAVQQYDVQLIAPSDSVVRHYGELLPELGQHFQVIPHGTRRLTPALAQVRTREHHRLRILIIGTLSANKGLGILQQIQDELLRFADLFLVGVGFEAKQFERIAGITIIREYELENLPEILADLDPDLALLPSVVPETFSFTLQELFELGIPALATRLGSFADRIVDGQNGFLCEPCSEDVVRCLRRLDQSRSELEVVRQRLSTLTHRTVQDMASDYERIQRTPRLSYRSYWAPDSRTFLRSPRFTRCRVFWRPDNQAFEEASSASVTYAPGAETQTVRIEIPSIGYPPAELRLDLAEDMGLLVLHALRILDADGRGVWHWNQTRDDLSPYLTERLVLIKHGTPPVSILCMLDKSSPLLLHVNELLRLENGGAVEAEISWLRVDDSISILRDECAQPDHLPALDRLLDRLKTGVSTSNGYAKIDRLLIDLELAQGRVTELERSLSWKITRPLRAFAERAPVLLRAAGRWIR